MRTRTTLFLLALGSLGLAGEGKEWGEGIPFTTDWKQAIREARNTGKMLFIYNGWEGDRI